MDEEFNLENVARFLESLKEIEPEKAQRNTIRQVVMELAPLIRELTDRGYTQKQVYDLIRERYGIKLSFGTFRNYIVKRKGNDAPEE